MTAFKSRNKSLLCVHYFISLLSTVLLLEESLTQERLLNEELQERLDAVTSTGKCEQKAVRDTCTQLVFMWLQRGFALTVLCYTLISLSY